MINYKKNIFIDCEWFLNQHIYLLGYAYNQTMAFQLYGNLMSTTTFSMMLKGVENIYVYGPDIGMMEKYFDCDLRTYYRCFNLLSIIKKIEPNLPSYKLCDLERMAGIHRETMEYKMNIFQLHKDWFDPIKRERAMNYNKEDVINLIKVKNYFFQRNGITRKDIDQWRM